MMRWLLLLLIVAVPADLFAQGGPGLMTPQLQRGYNYIQDEAIQLNPRPALNFTGAGVTCVDNSGNSRTDCTITSGGGGAPTGYAYWGSGADATLSAEINLAALATGLVLNTAGTPSQYPGTTCTNQVIRLLSASGAATCQTITSAYVDTSVWTGTVSSGLLKASSQGVLAQAVLGTDYATAFSHLTGSLALSQTSMATARLLGRTTAGTGVFEELTGTQATTLLDVFTSGLKGLAPSSGGGTTNFLRADGTWAAPPGGGGAPTDATYWVGAAHASLSAEINLGALGTGLVINTAGTPSIYAGTSCTNQFPRSLSASGAATCADVLPADFASQTANFVLAAPSGSAGDPTFRALVDNDIPNTITIDLATAASALSADPADCSGNNFALGIVANGTATCAQPAFSNLSGSATDGQIPNTITIDNLTQITTRAISDTTGTLLVGRGGTGQTTITTNQLYVGTALDTLAAKTIPSCSNGTTSKLLYDNATQTFSCGTDQGGGGGSANTVQVIVDFGATGASHAKTVVTGQAWVSTSSVIVCSPTMMATADRTDGMEDAILEGLTVSAYARVAATGFTVAANPSRGKAYRKFAIHCTGA